MLSTLVCGPDLRNLIGTPFRCDTFAQPSLDNDREGAVSQLRRKWCEWSLQRFLFPPHLASPRPHLVPTALRAPHWDTRPHVCSHP